MLLAIHAARSLSALELLRDEIREITMRSLMGEARQKTEEGQSCRDQAEA